MAVLWTKAFKHFPAVVVVMAMLVILVVFVLHPKDFWHTLEEKNIKGQDNEDKEPKPPRANLGVQSENSKNMAQHPSFASLEVLASKNKRGWYFRNCDGSRQLRQVSLTTPLGEMRMYVYNSAAEDSTTTRKALKGWYFERNEIARFLNVSRDLPLIDVGANLGLVTLQAAMQKRQVVAVEPVSENALRLCRSVVDFGHSPLVHVIQNAASSAEGNLTLATDKPKGHWFARSETEKWKYDATVVYSIQLDSILELLPFRRAALKMDAERHEGHVLAGAKRLFQEVDIPLIWMEWKHVKTKPEYGGSYVLRFMEERGFKAHNLMTDKPLKPSDFLKWPFSVLWRKSVR